MYNKISIRKASLNDVSHIKQVAEETWPICYKEIISPEQIRYMLDWMYSEEKIEQSIQNPKEAYYVFEQNGEIQGFCAIEFHYPSTTYLRIHKLYVHPNIQGTGAGKKLIQHIAQIGKEKGLTQLHLHVNKQNPAVSFYKHIGFEILQSEVNDIGNGFVMDDYIMVKKLNRIQSSSKG